MEPIKASVASPIIVFFEFSSPRALGPLMINFSISIFPPNLVNHSSLTICALSSDLSPTLN